MADNIIHNAEVVRRVRPDMTAYFDDASGAIVVVNTKGPSTMFTGTEADFWNLK
jgi:hypothetical protein